MASENSRIKGELLDELLKGNDRKTLFERDGLLDELKKALAERALNTELDHHLEQDAERAAGNHRNGSNSKTVLTENGKLALSIPSADLLAGGEGTVCATFRRTVCDRRRVIDSMQPAHTQKI